MKKIFTLICLAMIAIGANAQNKVYKYCIPADFDMKEFHKVIEAKDENGELMGTIEILSSPAKDQLYPYKKDETGEPILDSEGKPQFDEEHPNEAWKFRVNDPESNMSLTGLEEGFGYCIIGYGNPVMSQDEGWVFNDDKGEWRWQVSNPVYWTPGCGELPKQGEYIKITPKADGVITIGTFMNKGGGVNGNGHQLYIIDESTKADGYKVLGNDQVVIKGYFNNNTRTFSVNKETATVDPDTGKITWTKVKDENGEDVKEYPWGETLPYTMSLANDYSVFAYMMDGHLKRLDQVFLGLVSFDVKKDVTYWMLNPTSQFGFYGFKLEVGASLASIESVKSFDEDPNAPTYNLAGQRVDENYHGVVIKNGKKFMNK